MSGPVARTDRSRSTPARLLLATLLAATLIQGGCAVVAATGITAGAMAFADRRTVGTQTEDQGIEFKAMQHLSNTAGAAGVSATSFNRKVLLTGQVPDEKTRREVAGVVSRIEQVKMVHNELQVGPRASLTTQANDAGLTTRIKAMMLDAKDVQANTIKVITENSVAFLMGIVTRAEGDRAAMIASRVSGIKRVVTVFEYASAEEIARIERKNQQGSSR